MHRVDAPGATAGNLFTEGNPTLGIPATTVGEDIMNDIQEELCNAIENAGISLVKGDQSQLQAAIEFYASNAGTNREAIVNLGLDASVAANALTIALKQQDGSSDPSASGAVRVSHRSVTLTDGSFSVQSYTAAESLTVAATDTLGHDDGADEKIYVYDTYDGSTHQIAVSSTRYNEAELHTITDISGGATTRNLIYGDTAATNASIRLIAVLLTNQTTAGQWGVEPTNIDIQGADYKFREVEYFAQTSDEFDFSSGGYASSEYAQMSNNSVTLSAGTWELSGVLRIIDNGTNHDATEVRCIWATSNGNNTTTPPASTISFAVERQFIFNATSGNNFTTNHHFMAPQQIIELTSETEIFLVGRATFSTAGQGAMTTAIIAKKLSA